MSERIINKIIYGSREQGFISDYHASTFNLTFYHTAVLVQKRFELSDNFFRQCTKIDFRELPLAAYILKAGIFENFIYKRGQTVSLPDDNSNVGIPLRLILPRNISDHFRIALNHGQRSAKIMGYIGKQLFLVTFRLCKLLCRLIKSINYMNAGARKARTHRLITRGAAVESILPEVKAMSERAFYELMEAVLSLPEARAVIQSRLPKMDGDP